MLVAKCRAGRLGGAALIVALAMSGGVFIGSSAVAQIFTAFSQSVAAGAVNDKALARFYRERNYAPLWTGREDAARRRALFAALSSAADQGLPSGRYDPAVLRAAFGAAQTSRSRGRAEVLASKMLLAYARDLQSGILTPSKIDPNIAEKPPRHDPFKTLEAFAASNPRQFLRELAPQTPGYVRLLKEKLALEDVLARGGWGPRVPVRKLQPGASGDAVVALRNRLIRMGYLHRRASVIYDSAVQGAVQLFQTDHGMTGDGVAGAATIAALNVEPVARLQQVIVALERLRWLNKPLGKRHILVNLADYHAYIVDDGNISFTTKVVIGKNARDLRTPEFSRMMTHLIVNPTWNVPRSIAVRDYLPKLKLNPTAVSFLRITDANGQPVDRARVNFSQYTKDTFPFSLKQPPSRGNALGLVKFMFPNRFNIYLHDTPTKYLFKREVRDYSHGCIRVARPFALAYALLARQSADPKRLFQTILATGKETQINLVKPVPVHLVYRTAWVSPTGRVEFRRDIYKRDAEIFRALARAGVALKGNQS